ncbi:glycosyltransferase family 2 protein [Paenibacillus zeisoli]|uniref:4,4'-diaponeurosporenoate glycosyltransferase n=1 Tax=Paenibacillus zeisoli TaxID=2496267 RepID=A0A433X669_9BACL|nr:glycosyltransferase family 2 protein [Paenibacillus zeisoli]RUT29542.1 glycosyltransferase family 2 protein [Paenibacillus zeisoli]
MTAEQPIVSLIIAVRNEGMNLLTTLESLKVSKTALPYEIIIVDDGSIDSCCEFLYGYRISAPVHYIRTGSIGPAEARNRGAEIARGKVCIFCSGHLYFEDYWMEKLIAPILGRDANCTSPGISRIKDTSGQIGYGQWLHLPEFTTEWIYDLPPSFEAAVMPWQCIAVELESFQSIGGFDREFKEETAIAAEFSLRMGLFGYRCRIEPAVHLLLVERTQFPYVPPVDYRGYHLLRMAVLHFNEERLLKTWEVVGRNEESEGWESEIKKSGAFQARERYKTNRRFDDNWFFDRYNIKF